jgi:branched-chain amino acid transport system substrate-binding protein
MLVVAFGSAASAASSKTILIGQNAIETGPAATSFDWTTGFEAYLNYVNSTGGINGYKFKAAVEDNAYTATQSAQAQSQLQGQNPFTTFVVGTVPVGAVVPSLKSQGYSGILYASCDGDQLDSLTSASLPLWGTVPSYSRLVKYDASFVMNTLKSKSFGFAYEDDSLAQGAAASVSKYVGTQGGSLTTKVAVPGTTTNYVPLATQLQASGAKTVLAWTDAPLLASLQKAAAQIGYHPIWVSPFFSQSTGYLKLAGSLAEGTYIDGYLPPDTATTPAMKLYTKWITEISPKWVDGGQNGWQMAAAMLAGVKIATNGNKALTPASLSKAMLKVSGKVALEQMSFTKTRHWGSSTAAMYQVQNGKFVQVKAPSPLPA